MKASQLILELQRAIEEHGDIPCLIEVDQDGWLSTVPVGEVSFEDREGYGESLALLQ